MVNLQALKKKESFKISKVIEYKNYNKNNKNLHQLNDEFLIYNLKTNFKEKVVDLFYEFQILKNMTYCSKKDKKIFESFGEKIEVKIKIIKQKLGLQKNIIGIVNFYHASEKMSETIQNKVFAIFKDVIILTSGAFCNNNQKFFTLFQKYENFLRKAILILMLKKFGVDWWDFKVEKKMSKLCKKRSKFDGFKFHPIFYADFLDLKKIIEANWDGLSCLLGGQKQRLIKFDELSKLRNLVAHGRFLTQEFEYLMDFSSIEGVFLEL